MNTLVHKWIETYMERGRTHIIRNVSLTVVLDLKNVKTSTEMSSFRSTPMQPTPHWEYKRLHKYLFPQPSFHTFSIRDFTVLIKASKDSLSGQV